MPAKVKKIALDIATTSYIENYRISVYLGVIRYAREHTSWQLMFNVDAFSLTHKFSKYEDLPRLGADGLIFLAGDEQSLARVEATGLPAVNITNVVSDHQFPCVVSDDYEVGRMAAQHFLERGFRNFAFCGSDNALWARQRAEGYARHLESLRFPCHFFQYDQEGGPNPRRDQDIADRMAGWLTETPKPLAVLGDHDTRALHVMEACKRLGLEVPNEVAIVGVDNNVMICDSVLPSISSVEQNKERVGYEAAAMLDRMISGEKIHQRLTVIPPKGVVTRMSSDVLAVDDPAVAKALLFIRDHLTEPIGIAQVVKAAGVSRSNLEHRFRDRLRTTVNHEIRKRRLKLAQTFLLDTLMSLDEIAAATGFRRATYFSNIFTEQMGLAPGAWRRLHGPKP